MERTGFHKEPSRTALERTELPAMDEPEEAIPRAVVPWNRDDDRSRYLGLRASGFGIRETLGLLAKHKSTLSKWRLDPVFVKLEESLPELRKTLALEYVGLEFMRNFRLILELDHRVISGSLNRKVQVDAEDNLTGGKIPQDAQDFQYLLKARAHYTPQQLQAIEQMFGRGNVGEEFNWTEVALALQQTEQGTEVRVATRQHRESKLARVEESGG